MRVFCIGDSIVFGQGDQARLGWVNRLPLLEEMQYFNLGVPGQTISEMLARAVKEIQARMVASHENLIIIGGGLNDLCRDLDKTPRTDLETLHAQIEALIGSMPPLAPTLCVGPFPISETYNPYFNNALGKDMLWENAAVEQADKIYEEICKSQNVPYLSMYPVLKENTQYMNSLEASDGIHPEQKGYEVAAQQISNWTALRQHLPITEQETK